MPKGQVPSRARCRLSLPSSKQIIAHISVAAQVRGWEPARADQYAAAAAALLDSKADPAAPNRQGETPVGLAAAWGLAPLEQLLQAALDKAARQEERSRLHDSFPGALPACTFGGPCGG